MVSKNKRNDETKPRLLCIDMAYTLKMVKERELQQEFESRSCGGYFEHVWGVHPIADVPESRLLNYEGFKLKIVNYSKDQTIIEGLSSYYAGLKFLLPLNFLVSQIRFTRYLISLVKNEHIDIILVTDPYFTGLIGLFIKWFTKAKLVIWVVANYDEIYQAIGRPAMPRLYKKRWIEKIIEKIVFPRADLVAGGNHNNLEFSLANGASLKKSTVFPIGKLIHRQHVLDPKSRERDILFSSSDDIYYFIYVGRMLNVKYPDDVIRAFGLICKGIQNCALIMVGDGPMLKELEAMAFEMGIQDKIHFTGNINQVRLANILGSCFAALSPLTGRSLIEASLAALPIVAYDRDWQLDFVTKSGNGIVVPFRDWQQMAVEALHLVHCPEDKKRYSEASRCIGLTFCDTDQIYAHEQNEFNKLLQTRV